jgi:hypothetical protein
MPKPSDLFVGVLDFFAILLPGAIATAILAPRVAPLIVGSLIQLPADAPGTWAIFLTCAYFLGHLIFQAGSFIDQLADQLRAHRKPADNENAYQCATRIKNALLVGDEQQAIKTFQWARSVLLVSCPTAAADVHRLEADSKFFRSLLVVCAFSGMVFFIEGNGLAGTVALALALPCSARYYERRLKSNTQAYIHVITMHRLGSLHSGQGDDGA